jgi:hypothetical protein
MWRVSGSFDFGYLFGDVVEYWHDVFELLAK